MDGRFAGALPKVDAWSCPSWSLSDLFSAVKDVMRPRNCVRSRIQLSRSAEVRTTLSEIWSFDLYKKIKHGDTEDLRTSD